MNRDEIAAMALALRPIGFGMMAVSALLVLTRPALWLWQLPAILGFLEHVPAMYAFLGIAGGLLWAIGSLMGVRHSGSGVRPLLILLVPWLVILAVGYVALTQDQVEHVLLDLDSAVYEESYDAVLVGTVTLPRPYTIGESEYGAWHAADRLQELRGVDGSYRSMLYDRVQALVAINSLDRADELSRWLVERDEHDVKGLALRAKVLYYDGDVDSAIEYVAKARAAEEATDSRDGGELTRWAEGMTSYYEAAAAVSDGDNELARSNLIAYMRLTLDPCLLRRVREDPRFASFLDTDEHQRLVAEARELLPDIEE